MSISQEIQDPFGKGTILQNAATVYIEQAQYDIALSCLSVARQIFDELHSPYSHDTQKEIDALQKKMSDEQFTALLTKFELEA